MNKKNKQAFTLVELIVVITILAILGTIAFISLQGYSQSSRDSVRISDMGNIKTSIELYIINAGKYPETTGGIAITYTGSEVWKQGTFGEQTFNNVSRLNSIPTDPLTGIEYTYSVINDRQEYEIAGIMEGDEIGFNPEVINTSLAGDKIVTALITGNYNGQVATVKDGTRTYVLAVPTIISGDISLTNIEDLITQNKLVFNGYNNLPSNYRNSSYNADGEVNLNLVNDGSYVVFSGSLDELKDENKQIEFITNLQTAYLGTDIVGEDKIDTILSYDVVNNVEGSKFIAQDIINKNVSSSVEVTSENQVNPSNGSCGSDNLKNLTIMPTNLCDFGTSINFIDNGYGLTYEWDCEGINGGSTTSCSANSYNNIMSQNYINPKKDSLYYLFETTTEESRVKWCNEQGYLGYSLFGLTIDSNKAQYTLSNWIYTTGTNNWVIGELTCENNGVCGIDDGGSYRSTPINLCKIGIASSVNYNGTNYSWSCTGLNSTVVNCSGSSDIDTQEHTFNNPTKNGKTIMQYGGDATSNTRNIWCQEQGYTSVLSYINGNYLGQQSTYGISSSNWASTSMSGGGDQIISITCTNN